MRKFSAKLISGRLTVDFNTTINISFKFIYQRRKLIWAGGKFVNKSHQMTEMASLIWIQWPTQSCKYRKLWSIGDKCYKKEKTNIEKRLNTRTAAKGYHSIIVILTHAENESESWYKFYSLKLSSAQFMKNEYIYCIQYINGRDIIWF